MPLGYFTRLILDGFYSNFTNCHRNNKDPYYDNDLIYVDSFRELLKSSGLLNNNPYSPKQIFVEFLIHQGFLKAKWCRRIVDLLLEISEPFNYLGSTLQNKDDILLLSLLALYRSMGYLKIKLPLSNSSYFEKYKLIYDSFDNSRTQTLGTSNPIHLFSIDLSRFGYPLRIFSSPRCIMSIFIQEQYSYNQSNFVITPKPGDTVVDAGGGWGDTCLYFANLVGPNGKVIIFEPFKANVEIIKHNIYSNPNIQTSIRISETALWENSSELYIEEDRLATGNTITNNPSKDKRNYLVSSTSLDYFVEANKIDKVDFIKMDIEGSELFALYGCINTIRRWKPNLSLSIYHRLDDISTIPKFLSNLNLGYKFFLKHSSIHREETVLFASTDRF